MTKILLINTRPTRNYQTLELDKSIQQYFDNLENKGPKLGDTRTEPNNGLLIIGNSLKNAGHHVEYLDINTLEYQYYQKSQQFFTVSEMVSLIEQQSIKFDFLFFSAIIVGIDDTLKIMDHIKKKYPEKIVVLGGTFATLQPDYCIKNSTGIDALVIGEGEIISLQIVNAYSSNDFTELQNLSGIYYREHIDGSYIKNSGSNLVNLNILGRLAQPDWSLLDNNQQHHTYRVFTARGCGFSCNFCVPSRLCRHRVRYFAPRLILDVLHELKYQRHVSNFVIGDLTFLFNEKHSHEILNLIIQNNINIPFWAQTHLSRISDENLGLLANAGCTQLAVGIESINPTVLANINKGINEREIIEKLTLIKKYGIEVQTYFIVGLPDDTTNSIELTKNFIKYSILNGYIDRTHIGMYVPYPGVVIPEHIRITSTNYSHYTQGVFRDIPATPVYQTNDLTQAQIYHAYKNCLAEVGEALATRRKASREYDTQSIVLGAEALSLCKRIKHYSSPTQTTVFNLVQGIRKHRLSFVSNNIQEVADFIYGNGEIYSVNEARSIISAIDGEVDIILCDADFKTDLSRAIIEQVKKTTNRSTLFFYSDTHCWNRTILNMILAEHAWDIQDLSIYITPANRLSKRLQSLLDDFGAKIKCEDNCSSANHPFDIIVNFELDGKKLIVDDLPFMTENCLLIDAGLGAISDEVYTLFSENNHTLLRPDMRTSIIAEVFQAMEYEKFRTYNVGVRVIDTHTFVSGGVVGKKGAIVLDSYSNPKHIIGIADGKGGILQKNKLKRENIQTLLKADKLIQSFKKVTVYEENK